jgi:hypothetical protein
MRQLYIIGSVCICCFAFLISCQHETKEAQKSKRTLPPVEARAQVDKATATTGDLIRYTLSASSEPQIKVEIPEMGSQIAGLRIVDIGKENPRERDGRKIIESWYQLKADLVGSYIIPGAVFSYKDEKGEKKELKTAQIFIEVKSVIEDKEAAKDIRDIKPLVTIKRNYTLLIALSIAGLLLLSLVIGGIYFYRTRYRKSKATPPMPAHELALEELDRLQREGLIAKGIYKEHYFKISEIFRRYLERRFHFQAVEKTTEEILPEILNIKGFDQMVKGSAKTFLYHTDLVKFAKYIPDTEEVDQEHKEAVNFINDTKEEEVQKPQP